jgi:membrane-associated protein
VTHFVSSYGLWVVAFLVFLEAAGGPVVPGETAFIVAAALASQGHGDVVAIVAVTIASAVGGAVAAYAIGRARGRELLATWPWFERLTRPGLERSDEFFRRHGAKALVLGRFVPFLRTTLGWMAGVAHMPFRRFLVWTVAGTVTWGCVVGVASYYLGQAVVDAIQRDAAIGLGLVGALALALVGAHVIRRRWQRA